MSRSPRINARIAGLLYLLCIACGFYAEMIVRAKLITAGNAAATATHILTSPALYRMGFFADVANMTLGVLSSVILYMLLKPVSRGLALTVLMFDIISNTVSLCGAVLLYAPLTILQGDMLQSSFTPAQIQAVVLLSINLYESAYALSLAFFSGSLFITGYLIFRSTFVPKAIGVLLVLAGLGYLTNSFVDFMPKGFGDQLFPWILLPCILGEGIWALWLLIFGIDSSKWHAFVAARNAAALT